jgi:spore coat protein U-like protein
MRSTTLLLAFALALAARPASAACSVTVAPVAFGTINSMAQSRGTGEVVVRCDEPASFRVGLSPGRGGGDGRRMEGPGGARLDYGLFADPGYTIPWGDGQAIGNPMAGRSEGTGPVRLTIYGIIPRQPGLPAGEYGDSLQVTLSF